MTAQPFFEPDACSITYVVYDQPSSACAVIAPVLYDDLKSGCTHLLTVWNRRLSGLEAVIRADAAGANDCLTIQDFNKSASAMFASSFNARRNHSHIRQHSGYRTNLPAVRAVAAPHRRLRAVDGCVLHRKAARRGGPVSEPTGQHAGHRRGREEPVPGARAHPADAADGFWLRLHGCGGCAMRWPARPSGGPQ